MTLTAVVQPGHVVELAGSISGDQVAGINVWFSGAVTGYTTTDSSGHYTYSTSDASLGTVSATGRDWLWMPITDTAQATISMADPILSLNIACVSKNTVTLTGHLTDIDAAGRTVMFSGVATGMTTTDGNGNFSFTTTAQSLGEITASAVNLWGKSTNTATVTVTSLVPVIDTFTATLGINNTWIFAGHVTDEDAAGLTIYFGGLTSLTGRSVVVDENGYFTFTCSVDDSELGSTATATTTDWWGLQSAEAWQIVG